MPIATRRGRHTPATIWAAVAAALIFHVAVLGSVEAFDLSVVGDGFTRDHHVAAKDGADELELQTNCIADALLASSARFTICFAPWQEDPDRCLGSAELDMRIDLSSCEAQRNPDAIAQISMIEPKQADKVTPIDPEPLIEAMKEPEKAKPPELKPQQPQVAQPTPPPPPPPPAQKRPAQIVETAKPNSEKEPENARFLSEFNTVAEKEHVARGSVKEPMVAKSKPEELTAKDKPKEASIEKQDEDRAKGANKNAPDVPGSLAMRTPGVQHPADLQQDAKTKGSSGGAMGPLAFDGYMPRKGDGAFEQQQRQRSEIPRGQYGAGGGTPDVNLKPSQDVLERALGGGSVDHFDDVLAGDETAVNAKRWVHASFFNRLKRQVAQNWDPASVWRRNDPNGQVYGFKTRVTEVRVALSTKGDLAKIVVTNPSGVSELDDEAVRAFQAAGPFPNPPKELANSDGLITFAFSFYFEIGQPRSSWRVVRSM
ncbi:MAG TPA: TonB family protein [Kofleriaceae bacterium]|nr:TonB family protein [Kofleriaceae bacterium]